MTLPLLLAIPLVAGCASRDHDNPLDPENPATGGRPSVLTAFAGDACVEIRWETLDFRDLRRQLLWREAGGKSELVAEFTPDVTRWCNEGVRNGTVYTFKLGWQFDGSEETLVLPDSRTRPGSAWVWVADVTGGGLISMTPDGQQVRFRVGDGRAILDLTVQPETGTVWGADFDSGEILSYNPAEESEAAVPFIGVNTVSFDPSAEIIWAGAFFEETVQAYNTSGELVAIFEDIGLVEDVEVVPGQGVYVASRGGEVRWMTIIADPQLVFQASWPVALQYDDANFGVWICDRAAREVVFLPHGGDQASSVIDGLDVPVDLSVDGEGRCWVADRGGRVIRLKREGGSDLTLDLDVMPEGVTVDPVRREVWVAAPREGSVRVFSVGGEELFRWEGVLWPKKVEGAWDPTKGWQCQTGRDEG
jgi:DNA-binding beta-propeller fold protein YncE